MSNSWLNRMELRSLMNTSHPSTRSTLMLQRIVLTLLLLVRPGFPASCCCAAIATGSLSASCSDSCECCCADLKSPPLARCCTPIPETSRNRGACDGCPDCHCDETQQAPDVFLADKPAKSPDAGLSAFCLTGAGVLAVADSDVSKDFYSDAGLPRPHNTRQAMLCVWQN